VNEVEAAQAERIGRLQKALVALIIFLSRAQIISNDEADLIGAMLVDPPKPDP
jgi:hypothetical protein